MDLGNDERVKQLNEQIQQEKDPTKLARLIDELLRLTDPKSPMPTDNTP